MRTIIHTKCDGEELCKHHIHRHTITLCAAKSRIARLGPGVLDLRQARLAGLRNPPSNNLSSLKQ
jgi:hypothetical protein